MSMVELRPTMRKSYSECLKDISKIVLSVPNDRYHFFFEFEAGFDYALRLDTSLSCSGVVSIVEALLGESFTASYYALEVDSFGGAVDDCYLLFSAVSRVALKISLLEPRGSRVEADDMLHLVANVLSGSLVDEARLCRARASKADP